MSGEGVGTEERAPGVGVGVFVMRGDRFLMLRRRGSHGSGTWSVPGGGVAWGETVSECACREVFEETGVALAPETVRIGPVTNDIFPEEGKHYVGVYASAPLPGGAEPRIVEPSKADAIGWYGFDDLPSPLFAPLRDLLVLGIRPPFPQPDVAPAARFPR